MKDSETRELEILRREHDALRDCFSAIWESDEKMIVATAFYANGLITGFSEILRAYDKKDKGDAT